MVHNGSRMVIFRGFPSGAGVRIHLPMQEMQAMEFSAGQEGTLEAANGNPLQCSRLKNSMDREEVWYEVHGLPQRLDT